MREEGRPSSRTLPLLTQHAAIVASAHDGLAGQTSGWDTTHSISALVASSPLQRGGQPSLTTVCATSSCVASASVVPANCRPLCPLLGWILGRIHIACNESREALLKRAQECDGKDQRRREGAESDG